MKLKIIEDTGIYKVNSNGIREQTLIFKLGLIQYKISIRSDSIEEQSYAKLFKWTDKNGFSLIINKNPVKHYGLDISYKEKIEGTEFKKIIDDLVRIAKDFIARDV